MSPRSIGLSQSLQDYLSSVGMREPAALERVREDTAGRPGAGMQIAPEQGQLMAMLVRLIAARRCLEIGTYTGYSALAVALALPPDGRLIACERDAAIAEVARTHWRAAGVDSRIELRLGPALPTLDAMLSAGDAGSLDFAFIDADKESQWAYYERCLALVRRGGLILVDNTLWDGRVADPAHQDRDTQAIREFNVRVHADPRVEMVLLPVGDGLTLVRPL